MDEMHRQGREADITRQYVEYYLNHRAADQQGKTFCIEMNIQAKTAENDKIRMTYDEAYLSNLSAFELSFFYQERKELPQWTGAGPVIPSIEGKDMLTKLNLANAKISLVISGSSVTDITVNSKASLTCRVEIPVTVEIPDTLPGGKLLWFYKEMPWKNITETSNTVAFTVKYDSLSTILNEDCPRSERVKFCYESAGGNHVNDLSLAPDILDNSSIVIELYSQAFLKACLQDLQQNPGTDPAAEPVLRQYDITAFETAEANDSIRYPQVRPAASAGNTITGTNLTKMPENW